MAYVIQGNLYFQDGSNPLQQLTHGPAAGHPIAFSEDGGKIFFWRGPRASSIYAINIDGSAEQALVTNDLLRTFDTDYDETTIPCDPAPVPHTSLLLFRTCSGSGPGGPVQEDDLFIVDADTHQIKELFSRGQGGGYFVSPDGTMIAMDRKSSYIDIIGLDGRMIRHKIAMYPLSEPIPLYSRVYWLSNSRELILALPINTFFEMGLPPTYAVWRYSLDTGKRVQIDLDPPVMSYETTRISSDGNWITYCNHDKGRFLGSLRDGHTQPIGLPGPWSQDNVHFVYDISLSDTIRPGLYLASVGAAPVFIDNSDFIAWLDASRYIYLRSAPHEIPAYIMGEIGKEPVTILAGNVETMRSYGSIVFHYQSPHK